MTNANIKKAVEDIQLAFGKFLAAVSKTASVAPKDQPYVILRKMEFSADDPVYCRADAEVVTGRVKAADFYLMQDVVNAAAQYKAVRILSDCNQKLAPPGVARSEHPDVRRWWALLGTAVDRFQEGKLCP